MTGFQGTVLLNCRNLTFLPLPLSPLPYPLEDGAANESVLKVLGGMVMSCYAKYWIYVCGGMFIMVSFAGKLVGYKIVYMLLFLLCLCLYQVRTGLHETACGSRVHLGGT